MYSVYVQQGADVYFCHKTLNFFSTLYCTSVFHSNMCDYLYNIGEPVFMPFCLLSFFLYYIPGRLIITDVNMYTSHARTMSSMLGGFGWVH